MSGSPSLIPTEVATTEFMSDSPDVDIPLEDGEGNDLSSLVPQNASAPSLGLPTLASVFDPASVSPFMSFPSVFAPTVSVNDTTHMYQQFIQVGETAEQARSAVLRTEAEAERRHRTQAQQQAYLASMEVQQMELRAEQNHEDRMSECKAELKQASQREKFLLREMASCRKELETMELTFHQRHHVEMNRLRTTLVEEGERNKNEALNFVGLRFKELLQETEESMHVKFSQEISEMSEQNERLQDELAAAERSLLMEGKANKGGNGQEAAPKEQAEPPKPETTSKTVFSNPYEIPESLKHLFATKSQTPSVPPGFEGIPKDQSATNKDESAKNGVPSAEPSSNPEINAAALLQAAINLGNKPESDDNKPKVKEAESIKLPDYPNPETYRSWKISVREMVRAASDRPDEAFRWVQETYNKDATVTSLHDTGKFLTLDTKLLAALTKVARGEIARQVLNFKETEASAGRAVRGRQVLWMFHQHFKTNEEVGSLYSVEDLLKVTLVGDDLATFLYNFESVIAGMSHVPDEVTLRDIFLRQVRKSASIKYDLQIFDRAKEGTPTHTYEFLVNAVREYLTRERMRKNRDRIAKSHGEKYGAPAYDTERPSPRGGRGRSSSRSSSKSRASSQRSSLRSPRRSQSPSNMLCHDFQRGKCTRGDKCKYLHKPKSRSPSRQPSVSRAPLKKINATCMFWKKGKCKKGSECRFLHEDKAKPSTAAPTEQAAPAKPPDKPRSPTPDPKTRRTRSRGRSKSKDKGRSAACCISYALAAVPDAAQDRNGIQGPTKKLRFKETPKIKQIPMEGNGFRHRTKPRTFEVCYLDAESCPPSNPKDLKQAIKVASELEGIVSSMVNGVSAPCNYMCGDDEDENSEHPASILSCEHCCNLNSRACPGFNAGLEFLADTGSEEDLISKHDHATYYASAPIKNATRPVNLITANGPVQGNKAININLPELKLPVECYLLESTPPVCSVGRRCLDEDYDFHWPRGQAPYFITPEGKRIQCKLKGRVPVISSEDTVASPASLDSSKRSAGAQVFNAESVKVELATPAEDKSSGFQ